MGLAYFFLFIMILGAAGAAVALLVLAWIIWKKSRFKIFAIIPVLWLCLALLQHFTYWQSFGESRPGGSISDRLINLLNKSLGKMSRSRRQKIITVRSVELWQNFN